MTELTEHTRTILRAIVDGKQIEDETNDGYRTVHAGMVLRILAGGGQRLRIKPETRSINGVEFAAPTSIRCPIVHTFSQKQLAALCEFKWVMRDSRDTAYQAIVDALEGKSK